MRFENCQRPPRGGSALVGRVHHMQTKQRSLSRGTRGKRIICTAATSHLLFDSCMVHVPLEHESGDHVAVEKPSHTTSISQR